MKLAVNGTILLGLVAAACGSDDPGPCSGPACSVAAPGAPAFEGVRSVAPDSTGARLRVTWSPARDDKTPPEGIVYRVYVSTRPGQATRRASVATTAPGATSVYVQVAPLGATHHVVVHAVDADGNEDANATEKSTVAAGDTTPPTFGGIKTATPFQEGGVKLVWEPGTDDRTPVEGLRYAVETDDGQLLTTVDAQSEVVLTNVGVPGAERRFLVRAVDAAGLFSANGTPTVAMLGRDETPPVFAGCGEAAALGSRVVRVSWPAAVDEVTPPGQLVYEVALAGAGGAPGPTLATTTGETSVLVRDLAPGTEQHLVCRVRDEAGNVDSNTKTVSARTTTNVVPPSFAGAAAAVVDPAARSVTLTWTAGTDDVTSPDKLVYVVYAARGTSAFDFTRPLVATNPGATAAVVTGLAPRTDYRFIVRARDADYNEDANALASGGRTGTSWAENVVPLLATNCAVVGCHAAGATAGGLSLSAFNAYESLVGVNAAQRPTAKRVVPSSSADSYLYAKVMNVGIVGNPMPAPGTGNLLSDEQKDIVKSWIDEGALRN